MTVILIMVSIYFREEGTVFFHTDPTTHIRSESKFEWLRAKVDFYRILNRSHIKKNYNVKNTHSHYKWKRTYTNTTYLIHIVKHNLRRLVAVVISVLAFLMLRLRVSKPTAPSIVWFLIKIYNVNNCKVVVKFFAR